MKDDGLVGKIGLDTDFKLMDGKKNVNGAGQRRHLNIGTWNN